MADILKVGMQVWVSFPGKLELNGKGFILIGPVPRGDHNIFKVDMGDHDNWFPEDWLSPFTGMEY